MKTIEDVETFDLIERAKSILVTVSAELRKKYRKSFNIRHTKSQNLNESRLVLQLPLPNPVKPGVQSRMKM